MISEKKDIEEVFQSHFNIHNLASNDGQSGNRICHHLAEKMVQSKLALVFVDEVEPLEDAADDLLHEKEKVSQLVKKTEELETLKKSLEGKILVLVDQKNKQKEKFERMKKQKDKLQTKLKEKI